MIPNTPKPIYPNVPAASGVPPLLRQVGVIQDTIVQVVADALIIYNLFQTPQWGLFNPDGTSAFAATSPFSSISGVAAAIVQVLGPGGRSVGDVEYRQENRISTAPQEDGAFMSYNKVASPWDGRVTYLVGGTQAQRTAFLNQVQNLTSSLTILNLIMPEKTYTSCNVVHHLFRRAAHAGLTLLAVDIWVQEVRVAGPPAFSNTTTASGANPVNGGTVQPQNASAVTGRLAGPT